MSTPYAAPNVLVLLPARARQVLYVLFGLAALGNGSALVGYAAGEFPIPVWLVVSTAVLAYLAVPFSALAALNATPTATEQRAKAAAHVDQPEPEPARAEPELIGGIPREDY